MRRPLILSVAIHLGALLLAVIGLPTSPPVPPEEAIPISVDIVPVGDVTTGSRPETRPEPTPKPPAPSRPQAEAAPETRPAATQRPDPVPPEPVPLPSPPSPTPPPPRRPAAEPAVAPTPAPTPAPQTDIVEAPPLPSQKPSPPPLPKPPAPAEAGSDFASVMKTVENLKRREAATRPSTSAPRAEPPRSAAEKTSDSSDDQIARILEAQSGRDGQGSQPMTVSEIDVVRRQIERCWNVPAGARDAENLVVKVRVELNVDGTPRTAAIVDDGRVRTDSFYRAAAESALRAVLNPRCHPFKLPAEKYDRWKSMTLVFNPRDMVGT